MKKLVLLVSLFLLVSSNDVSARGFVNNPDRFPSVGLSFGLNSLGGDTSFLINGAGVPPAAATDLETKDLTLDFRLPVSHSLTVFGGISVIRNSFSINGQTPLALEEQNRELDGYGIRFGARFYFNR